MATRNVNDLLDEWNACIGLVNGRVRADDLSIALQIVRDAHQELSAKGFEDFLDIIYRQVVGGRTEVLAWLLIPEGGTR